MADALRCYYTQQHTTTTTNQNEVDGLSAKYLGGRYRWAIKHREDQRGMATRSDRSILAPAESAAPPHHVWLAVTVGR